MADNRLKTKENFVYPECEWGYRLLGVIGLGGLIFLFSMFAVIIRDNVVKAEIDEVMGEFYKFSSHHGLGVDDVILEGNVRTSYDDLIQALNLSENESILGVDIAKLQERIEELTWVKKCVVKRSFFPNNILVEIKERKVKAVWQFEGRYYPVDEGGNVIDVEDFEPDGKILLIAGENAPNHLVELMKVVETDKELLSKLKAAVYVSNRRWDLVFSKDGSGLVVKMPQDNFEKAYKKIALLNKRQGIFKRKLTSFDVRYDNRIVVDIDKSTFDMMIER